ncbi:MAG: hypothetical protein CL920_34540 [Deltaproteobacteria bacterium]|nr:hypothetical protein [Deltaproteobacteria bacterium]MBU53844.1 hypothetical protein [Deltaproteobacteria bacterium]
MKINRLWLPLLVFLGFLAASFFSGNLGLTQKTLGNTERVFFYALHIGIWLSAAYLLNRLLHIFFWDGVFTRFTGGSTPKLLKDVVGFLFYVIALTGIIGVVFQKSVTGIWATSGAVGLVLGFALRSIILDVFTGLAVGVDRPYSIGDWIMLHGKRPSLHIIGRVEEINWRTTRVATKDGNILIVPNSIMGQTMITNFMMPASHNRHEIFFTLDFSVPPERAERILLAGAKAACGKGTKSPLESPAPKVRIIRTTHLGVEYRVRYWLIPKDISPGRGRHQITKSILEHLQQAGLTLAYPKQDIYHDEMPNRHLDARSIEDRKSLLSRIDLFSKLNDEELHFLAENMERELVDEGAKLIKRNDDGDSMFILVEGLLDIFADIDGSGKERKVAQLNPGSFLGEMSLLTGEPRSATVITSTESVLYKITKKHMDTLLQKRPALLDLLSHTIAERQLRETHLKDNQDTEAFEQEESNLANQLVGKMRSFFGNIFDKVTNSRSDLPAVNDSSEPK